MHHYDMNLCYIDELLWHLNWTGDLEYAVACGLYLLVILPGRSSTMIPIIDGLYDAYACIWASDASTTTAVPSLTVLLITIVPIALLL